MAGWGGRRFDDALLLSSGKFLGKGTAMTRPRFVKTGLDAGDEGSLRDEKRGRGLASIDWPRCR